MSIASPVHDDQFYAGMDCPGRDNKRHDPELIHENILPLSTPLPFNLVKASLTCVLNLILMCRALLLCETEMYCDDNIVAAAENGPLVVQPLNADSASRIGQMVTVDAGTLVRMLFTSVCAGLDYVSI